MKLNMGLIDRVIRIIIVLTVGVLYYINIISGTLALVLGIVAVIFLLTSLIGWCPIYHVLGISSMKKKEKEAKEAKKKVK